MVKTNSLRFVIMHHNDDGGQDLYLGEFQYRIVLMDQKESKRTLDERLETHGTGTIKLTIILKPHVKKQKQPAMRKEKIQYHDGHEFKFGRFITQPLTCMVCTRYMMSGYQCEICQIPVHKNHLPELMRPCKNEEENVRRNVIDFKLPHTFGKSHMCKIPNSSCDSCGKPLFLQQIITCKNAICKGKYHLQHQKDNNIPPNCGVPETEFIKVLRKTSIKKKVESHSSSRQHPPTPTEIDQISPSDDKDPIEVFIDMIDNNARLNIPKYKDLTFKQVLGRGAYGKVFWVQFDDKNYALKAMSKSEIQERKEYDMIHTEKWVSAIGSGSPFLASLHSAFQDEKYLFLLMEYISGGDLIYHMNNRALSINDVRFYAAEMALAIIFLHSHGIIHRDLKPDNILLDEDGHVKVADFGLARLNIKDGKKTYTPCGTPGYLAPEVISEKNKKGYGVSCDWWSYGVIIYELITTITPFHDEDDDKMLTKIVEDDPNFSSTLFNKESKIMLKKLLEKDPKKRLSSEDGHLEDVKAEKFFEAIDWVKLESKQIDPPYQPSKEESNVDHEYQIVSIIHYVINSFT